MSFLLKKLLFSVIIASVGFGGSYMCMAPSAPVLVTSVMEYYEVWDVTYDRGLRMPGAYGIYYPDRDLVRLKAVDWYNTIGDSNQVAMHELCHWARDHERLGHPATRGIKSYNFEEMVVHICAALICDMNKVPHQADAGVAHYVKKYQGNTVFSDKSFEMYLKEIKKTVEYVTNREIPLETVRNYVNKLEINK